MISSNDFSTGSTIELDGQAWKVIDFQHVKPGKGSAFVRTTLRNVQSGKVLERTFRAGEMMPTAVVERSEMQFLYLQADAYVFMNNETYEQAELKASEIGSQVKYLKEGLVANVLVYKNNVIGVELPNTVTLVVVQTDPGFKGNTATNTLKPATVETGAVVPVPLFINIGEKIKIDTRTDEYLGRES